MKTGVLTAMNTTKTFKNKITYNTTGRDKLKLTFLILSSMMTMMGGAAVAPSLPGISAYFSGYPESVIALIITLPSLAIVLSGWFIGMICDRVGKVRPLMISLAFFALFGSSGAYLSSLEMILVGRALLGIAIAGIMTTTIALVSDYYSGPARIRVIGYQSAAMGIGAIVLETSGGLLASFGWRETFLIYLIALLFIPGVLFTMKEPKREDYNSGSQDFNESKVEKKGVSFTQLALIYISVFGVMLMFYTLPTKLPYLLQAAGISSTVVSGALLGIPGFISAFSALSCSRLYYYLKRNTIMATGFLLIALGFLIIGTVSGLIFLILGLVLVGTGQGLLLPTLVGWLSEIAPAKRYGTLYGIYSVFFYFGQFVSGFVSQPIIDISGTYQMVFTLGGLYSIVMTAVFVFLIFGKKVHAKNKQEPDKIT